MRTLLAALLLAASVLANGTIEVRGARGGRLLLQKHAVNAAVRDQLAEVTVEQVFQSACGARVEGIYVFALPPGASVSAFEMTVDGKTMHGEVVERGKARRIYENIVRQQRDPALLEKIDDRTFRARVFPIDPGKAVAIKLTYQQLLDDHDGRLELTYPLARERLGSDEVARIELRVEVESSIDLLGVASPSHALVVKSEGKRHATLELAGGAELQDKDLVVAIRRDPTAIGFTLLGHRAPGEPGTFLAILSPPTRLPAEAIPPRDLVYVLDTSGSMEGEKIAQAKAALKHGIALLRPRDRFRIVAFATEVNPFRDGWTGASPEDKAAAEAWIDRLWASGGTALDHALEEGLKAGDPDRLTLMVLLTDGLPTVGERDGARIVARAKAWNRAAMRVFCFGVGFDSNVPFLDELARATRATNEYVTKGQDLAVVLGRFFDRVQQPALTDLQVDWGGHAEAVYPNPLPDLFAGDRLVIVGRYGAAAGPRAVTLKGKRLGEPVAFTYEGTLPEKGGVEAVERLWAQRKIDFLLAEIGRHGSSGELRDEIVRLATRHHIVTPYTAGLVVEDGPLPGTDVVQNEPGVPEEEIVELPIETEEMSDGNAVDTDSAFEETDGADGLSDAPFTGSSSNSAIGLGGGPGGGRRHLRAGHGSARVGADAATDAAVELHLTWLATQQDDQTGRIGAGVEDTALAVLAYLGAGYTDRGSQRENPHAKTVRMGLRYLMLCQDTDGLIGGTKAWPTEHAMATLALSEAYWLTRNPRYRNPAQLALTYLARNHLARGGWGDTEAGILPSIWATMALKSGKFAGLEVDPDAFESMRLLLDARRAGLTPAEQAGALMARVQLGEDPRSSNLIRDYARTLRAHRPEWKPATDATAADARPIDIDLWYWGTLALWQTGGQDWRDWNEAMKTAIATTQLPKTAGPAAGTWPIGGPTPKVSDQAKLAMCLEVYYRYDRVFGVR